MMIVVARTTVARANLANSVTQAGRSYGHVVTVDEVEEGSLDVDAVRDRGCR